MCISNKELAHIWWDGIWTCLSDDWAVVWCLHYATRVRDYSWYIYIGFVKVGIVDSLFSSELMFGISHSDSCMQVLWEANCTLFYTGSWSMSGRDSVRVRHVVARCILRYYCTFGIGMQSCLESTGSAGFSWR